MKSWQRKILFWALLFLFLIIGPYLVLYSQGYRFDFEKRKFVQTGGLYIKAHPKQAEVYLNGKFIKKTDPFFGSFFVQELLPKKYEVEVKKEGFFSWKKNLEINEKKVAEAKHIILFPKNLNLEKIDFEINDFYLSPDGKKIILVQKEKEVWALKLYEIEKKLKSHLVSEKEISKTGAGLLNLEFSENPNLIKLTLGIKEELNLFSLDISFSPPILKRIEENKQKNEKIVTTKKVGKDIYSLDIEGNFFKNEQKINSEPLPIEKESEYSIEVIPENIILKAKKSDYESQFFLFNPESRVFEKFFEGGKDLKIAPDKKKAVYFSQYEIWLLFLEKELLQPEKNVGEKEFLLRFSKKIEDIFWLNSSYLIIVSEGAIQISEIDTRDTINFVEIAKFEKPKVFWNSLEKKLYILEKGVLYQASLL